MPLLSYNDILALDATSLSNALENSDIGIVELMKATLHQVDRVNPSVHAIVSLRDRNELMEEAAQASRSPRKGWLHGIPIAIKDLSNCKGIPTTFGGSPLFKDFVPGQSDPFVQRLIDAGAIVIGKTNTPESGLGSHTFNKRWGTTRNPCNLSRSAGGSSGGAAVAVATHILVLADGSDMMGSLRNPAGWNNLYSIRPTAGMLEYLESDRNPLDYPISTVGPIARSPEDLARCLETMAGSDRFQAPLDSFQASMEQLDMKGLKIAWLGDWAGAYPVEKDILGLCRLALCTFEKMGVEIDDMKKPIFPANKLWKSWTTIRSAVISSVEILVHGKDALRKSNIRSELKWEVERGLTISDEELAAAGFIAKEWSVRLEQLFTEGYDAIALPSAQVWPFPVDWDWPKEISGRRMDTYHRWMEIAVPISLAGLPCVTIPAGFGADSGVSMGIQIAGRRGEDAKLLQIANAYHGSTGWHSRQPECSDIS